MDGRKLKFALAASSNNPDLSPDAPAMAAIDGDPKTSWGLSGYGENSDLMLALRFAEKLKTQKNSVITVHLHQDSRSPPRRQVEDFASPCRTPGYSWPSFEKASAQGRRSHHNRAARQVRRDSGWASEIRRAQKR